MTVAEHVLEAIYAHARAAFPAECCGYVRGHAEADAEVVACTNAQELGGNPFAPDRAADSGFAIAGADRIAKLVISLRDKFWAADRTMEIETVNGETGLCIRDRRHLTATISIATTLRFVFGKINASASFCARSTYFQSLPRSVNDLTKDLL